MPAKNPFVQIFSSLAHTAKQLLDFSKPTPPALFAHDVSAAIESAGPLPLMALPTDGEVPFLIFRLGASLFGVPALSVREIHGIPALSPLSETAPWIVGVLHLRGAIVPVMDLSARMGQDAAPYELSDNLVVLGFEGADVALLVSEVRSVERLSPAQIEAAPAHGRGRVAAPFVAGVAQIGDDFVMLLHLPHLLDGAAPAAPTPTPALRCASVDARRARRSVGARRAVASCRWGCRK
jgi:purine-binding chemotaxis protein CheW